MSWNNNIVEAFIDRQIQEKSRLKYERQFQLTETLIKRLGLVHELEGHEGCVNCLDWHESGEILISGSDDCNINLWNPYKRKLIKTIQSGHRGNIFSVKYVKTTSDSCIASGAADHLIRVHDLTVSECILDCECHSNRVKRLATHPNEPFLLLSAAEDGLILQFDLRENHRCSDPCNNVLIDLKCSTGVSSEAKCLAINPAQPQLLAVGAHDPYVRIYDRRMISLTQARRSPSPYLSFLNFSRTLSQNTEASKSASSTLPPSNLPIDSVQYFIAGHLQAKRKPRAITCTYVSFNSKGNELLANLGGEQIYLFDINKHQPLFTLNLPTTAAPTPPKTVKISTTNGTTAKVISNGTCKEIGANGTKNGSVNGKNGLNSVTNKKLYDVYEVKQLLPAKVLLLKEKANERFDKGDYISAVSLYNQALKFCPNAAVLYGNRAIALMKRSWDGDIYSALRDCCIALKLDQDYFRAHFRMARCLYELKRYKEAHECFEVFKETFPEQAKDQSCTELEKQINDDLETYKEREDASTSSREDYCAFGLDDTREAVVAATAASSSSSSSTPRNANLGSKKISISDQEIIWRARASDFKQRFCGHCNTTTDIKEANFFGRDDQYIVAGSDDGNIFIWDRTTTNIVRVLKGDDSIVNCLQPHPYDCLLATSGIEYVVRLWAPKPEEGPDCKEANEVKDINSVVTANQKLMYENPLELALLNMSYRLGMDSDSSQHAEDLVQCRTC